MDNISDYTGLPGKVFSVSVVKKITIFFIEI